MTKLEDILKIEDTKEILSFKDSENNFLIWPLLRNEFIRTVVGELFYQENILTTTKPSFPNTHITITKAIIYNIIKKKELHGDILIHSSGSHIKTKNGYINRLTEHFINVDKYRTVALESISPIDWHWPFPRPNTNVLFDTDLLVYCRMKAIRSNSKHRKEAAEMLSFIENQAKIILNYTLTEDKRNWLTYFLTRQISSISPKMKYYNALFHHLDIKLLLIEEGCYGHSSVENQVAHENNIVVAEFQHGSISTGHDSYNFSDFIRKSTEYTKVLPNYLLSYGAYWTQQINAPIKHICIGNPLRTEKLKEFNKLKAKTDILVLGDGIDTNKYLSLCKKLSHIYFEKNYRIVFRPHPLERARFADNQKIGCVYVEYECDLYQAFESTEILISEVSTGLFEAIGVVDRILVWKTEKVNYCYPNTLPFHSFDNINELEIKLLKDTNFGKVAPSLINEFWCKNWKNNYINFLDSVLSK